MKSIYIVGNYGTGKSHFMAFITNVFKDGSLIEYIKDEGIKRELENKLKKNFVVLVYELQPTRLPLGAIFYAVVKKLLKEKYEIDIQVPTDLKEYNKVYDHKELIVEKIITPIKERLPERGIIMAFDELSDFLRQKKREEVNHDMQFIRILGEISNHYDVTFVFSMQENIFSSPEYQAQADALGRVYQRYDIIEITNEDIKKVLCDRIVSKEPSQKAVLRNQFARYKDFFEDFEAFEEEYINLYPIHPSVLTAFGLLPYFEKRGILTFAMDRVKKILDSDFPEFVTLDKIFDEIDSSPTISNRPEVRPVLDVAERLIDKCGDFDSYDLKNAAMLIKTLALYKLHKPEEKTTPVELSRNLLITPGEGTNIAVEDYVEMLLRRIKQKTAGQFIGYDETEKKYYIDLKKTVDYDEIIQSRARILSTDDIESYFFDYFIEVFSLEEESEIREKTVFKTTTYWENRNSFREGMLILENSDVRDAHNILSNLPERDFISVICSPFKETSSFEKGLENVAVIKLKISDSLENLKQYASIQSVIRDSQFPDVMKRKLNSAKEKLVESVLEDMLTSTISYGGKTVDIETVVGRGDYDISMCLEKMKTKIFSDYFLKKYPEHPKFTKRITAQNIDDFVKRALEDILYGDAENYRTETKTLLSDLELLSKGGLNLSNNQYLLAILQEIGDKLTEIKKIAVKMTKAPFGLFDGITYILLSLLLMNDEISLKRSDGTFIGVQELEGLVKGKGIGAFEAVRYAEPVLEFPIEKLEKLFEALDLDPSKIRIKNTRPQALKEYVAKNNEIADLVTEIERHKNVIGEMVTHGYNIPQEELNEMIEKINTIDISGLKVKSVKDLAKLKLEEEDINNIRDWRITVEKVAKLLRELDEFLPLCDYAKSALKVTQDYKDLFLTSNVEKLTSLSDEIFSVIESEDVLDPQKRLPVKGKLQEIKRRYIEAYSESHERHVGEGNEWSKLIEILNSSRFKELKVLSGIKCINEKVVEQIEDEIHSVLKLKCSSWLQNYLEHSVKCPCGYPDYYPKELNLSDISAKIKNRLEDLENEWEKLIVAELEKVRDKFELLEREDRMILEEIVSSEKLPAIINEDLTKAINNAFEDFEIVELSLKEFYDWLGGIALLMPPAELIERFNLYLTEKMPTGQNVRIKIVP